MGKIQMCKIMKSHYPPYICARGNDDGVLYQLSYLDYKQVKVGEERNMYTYYYEHNGKTVYWANKTLEKKGEVTNG